MRIRDLRSVVTGALLWVAAMVLSACMLEGDIEALRKKAAETNADVNLNKTALTLVVGNSETLTATVTPPNVSNKTVSWKSSDNSVATVSDGTVIAVAPGTATITVTTAESGKKAACTVTVNAVDVTGVTLNKTALTLSIGGTETLTAAVTPSNATDKAVNWTSSDNSVATVSGGTVTALAAGTASITVTTADGGKTATCSVTVQAAEPIVVDVTGVTLNKTEFTLTVGDTEVLSATLTPSDATNKAVTWASGNTAVATVNNGMVIAVAPGTASITVTTADGGKTATCAVTVQAALPNTIAVTGVTLNETALELIVGGTETLAATVAPSNATNKNITWTSSDTDVATVSTGGLVTAIAGGTATITVTTVNGGKTAVCSVTVTVPVTGVTLNKTTLALSTGGTETLEATIAQSNATNKAVTWVSSKPEVATVSADGLVTAIAAGTVTITVTTADGDKTAECAVTVTVAATGVTLSKSSLTLDVGDEETLTAAVAPANATNKRVTWVSSKPDIVTVTGGRISAVDSGTAVITVTTQDGGKTATCNVRVRVPVPSSSGGSGPTLKTLNGGITISPSAGVTTGTELTATYSGTETVTLAWQWRKGGAVISGATGTTYTPATAGSYTVTVSAAGYNSKTSAAVAVSDGGNLINVPFIGPSEKIISITRDITNDLSKSGGGSITLTINESFDEYEWYVGTTPVATGKSVTLQAANAVFIPGHNYITAVVYTGTGAAAIPWSGDFMIHVTD